MTGKPSFPLAVRDGRPVGHCFACGISGNAAQLVARARGITLAEAAVLLAGALGLPPGHPGDRPRPRGAVRPRTPAPWPPENLGPSDRLLAYGADLWRSCVPPTDPGRDWLRSRGVGEWADAILRTATDETAAIAGLRSIAGWVAIPWVTPDRQMVSVRFRRPWDGDGPSKLSPRTPEGVETCFPSPGMLRRPGAAEGGQWWIVEGETDALTVLQHEPTATVWMLSTARGWRSSWLRLLPPRGEIVVALDEDRAGLDGVRQIAADLARWIRQTGAAISVLRPRMLPGEDICEAVERIARERRQRPASPSRRVSPPWPSPDADKLRSLAEAIAREMMRRDDPADMPRMRALVHGFDGAWARRDLAALEAAVKNATAN